MSLEAAAPNGSRRSPAAGRGLRVGVDARLADGRSGGVQQFVIGLASGLSGLQDGDEEYVFLAQRGQGEWLERYVHGPCRILWVDPPRAGIATRLAQRARHVAGRVFPVARSAWRRLRSAAVGQKVAVPASDGAIEGADVEVMHFTQQGAFLTEVPSIYQPWDLQHVHLPQFFGEPELTRREVTYGEFCRRAKIVVVASEWTKQDVSRHYGIQESKIAVIEVPPVTSVYVEPDAAMLSQIETRLALPPRFLYYPAQTWPHKNHLRLLEALAMLRDRRGLHVNLVCSGVQNEHFAEIRAGIVRLGLQDAVRFIGFVEPLEVQVVYKAARGMVFPSLFEGWGLPVVEAFEGGVPVACSTVTSLPELVGDAALLFDPTDVIQIADSAARLWIDDELCRRLSTKGRAVAARFSWDRTARAYRACYRLVGGRSLSEEDRMRLVRAGGLALVAQPV